MEPAQTVPSSDQPAAPQPHLRPEPHTQPRAGRFGRGWELCKSAWQVLKLDKELAALPLIGSVVSIVAVAAFFGVSVAVSGLDTSSVSDGSSGLGDWTWPVLLAFYIVTATIANFFAGAVIHGAMTRFRGGDPTVGSSLKAAWHRLTPIFLFSAMMATIGLILDTLAERVPLAGRIAVWLVGAAWNVANFFALPVIMMEEQEVMPLQATKKSVALIRQVWGESAVAEAGIALVTFLAAVIYLMSASVIAAIIAAAGVMNVGIWIGLASLGILGLLILSLIFSVLGGIVKAAIYHYATTGESPETFNRDLLRTAMTQKKARRIFS